MIPIGTPARIYLVTVTALIGLLTAGIGVWCLIAPGPFAEFVGFPAHEHFVHDVGAFQVGLGVTLLLALIWSDALATALAGFIAANTIHTVNHVIDLDLGGSAAQAWLLGAASVALIVAFALRLRQLGYVLGNVSVATDRSLVPFVRQKTIRLTTFRKDGTAGTSPVSIVVDGDRAYFRSFERAIKVRRIRRHRTSNSARLPRRASRPVPCNVAGCACWTGTSIEQRRGCFGASIPSCTACWCPWRTASGGPSSAARYTSS